jgi:hypothetical protein
MSAMAVATAEEPEEAGLREEDRRILWEQFVEVYAHSHKSYDDAVRALAAAGVALTVSLATALHHFATSGLVAVIFFLVSLGLNLASFGTAQADMKTRIACLRARKTDGIEGNRWTTVTTALNGAAGAGVLTGSVLLAVYIAHAT